MNRRVVMIITYAFAAFFAAERGEVLGVGMKDVWDKDGGAAVLGGVYSVKCQDAVFPHAELLAKQVNPQPQVAGDYGRMLIQSKSARRYDQFGKRILDISLVLLSLPISLPIIMLCAIALWWESGLPFYRQARLGRGGRVFNIIKLRTMVRDADTMLEYYLDADENLRAEWDNTQKLKQDPRITRMGRLLRTTSLDELPQLWNVLIGEMSLVGPRPMMPDQLSLYGASDAYFALRPGITGVWQVSARNEASFGVRRQLDSNYLDDLSLRRDLRLLQRTFGVVIKRTGY